MSNCSNVCVGPLRLIRALSYHLLSCDFVLIAASSQKNYIFYNYYTLFKYFFLKHKEQVYRDKFLYGHYFALKTGESQNLLYSIIIQNRNYFHLDSISSYMIEMFSTGAINKLPWVPDSLYIK